MTRATVNTKTPQKEESPPIDPKDRDRCRLGGFFISSEAHALVLRACEENGLDPEKGLWLAARFQEKAYRYKTGGFRMDSQILRGVTQKYARYLEAFRSADLITYEKNGYRSGHYCRTFHAGRAFLAKGDRVEIHVPQDKQFISRPSNKLKTVPAHVQENQDWLRENVRIRRWDIPSGKLAKFDDWLTWNNHNSAVDVNGRVYDRFSNMDKAYRPAMRMEGEKVAVIDIRACQPSLFFNDLLGLTCIPETEKETIRGWLQGDLYTNLCPNLDRDKTKNFCQVLVFGKAWKVNNPVSRRVRDVCPKAYAAINELKWERGYKFFHGTATQTESAILNCVQDRIGQRGLRIHDCLIVPKSRARDTVKVFEKTLTEMGLGFLQLKVSGVKSISSSEGKREEGEAYVSQISIQPRPQTPVISQWWVPRSWTGPPGPLISLRAPPTTSKKKKRHDRQGPLCPIGEKN